MSEARVSPLGSAAEVRIASCLTSSSINQHMSSAVPRNTALTILGVAYGNFLKKATSPNRLG